MIDKFLSIKYSFVFASSKKEIHSILPTYLLKLVYDDKPNFKANIRQHTQSKVPIKRVDGIRVLVVNTKYRYFVKIKFYPLLHIFSLPLCIRK